MGVRLRNGVSAADTEYGSVLLDERSGDYWQLNPAGAHIVRLLLAGSSASEVAAALVAEFEVDPPGAERDVNAMITELESARLVTVTP